MSSMSRSRSRPLAYPLLLGLGLVGLTVGVGQAQPGLKTKPLPSGSVSKAGQPGGGVYTPGPLKTDNIAQKPDLAVVRFTGTWPKGNFLLGGTIKNVGAAPSPAGRQVRLFALTSTGGQALKTVEVPALKPGEEWSTPTFTIPSGSVQTTQFELTLSTSKDDANPRNDSKRTAVSEVR